jgi:epoxide hydrolase-like predicted phosphatase
VERAVRAVILDYGGVVRREDAADWDEVATAHGMPAGAAWAAFHDGPEYVASRTGRMGAEEFRGAVVRALARWTGPEGAERVLAEIEARERARPPIEPEMRALLERMRGRVRIGLLTNGGRGGGARLVASGVAAAFHDVVCSGDAGVAKPDPAAFRLAAERLGVATAECAFVDDLERNVLGARAAGMRAHHHHRTRPEALVAFLEDVGALAR